MLQEEMQGNWIARKAAGCPFPSEIQSALTQLNEVWHGQAIPLLEVIESFPLGEAALLHLLAVSPISLARLVRNPDLLLWLARPDVCLAWRSYAEMLAALEHHRSESIDTNAFRALRLWKNREITRIALREVAEVASLEDTTAELSQLAEISVDQVYQHWNDRLVQTIGRPKAEMTILALGKLGGRELNHSSDIDVFFLYDEEGQVSARLTNHQWFNRLAEKILTTFSTPDPEGTLFRVDVRLRPEGSAGPLARSLESMEHYYSGFGEIWERLALIKARRICGSRELAYEFLRQHQPFIYPRTPTPDVLDDIARIKRRIEREVVGTENLERNVKLGRGGIREIEFVVQTLQFIHGARHAFLQETSTLKALTALARLELIPKKAVLDLDRAYHFLRRTEHRLQMESEQQTHTLPRDESSIARLATSLGFASGPEFTNALQQTMQAVHTIFETIITTSAEESLKVDLAIFHDQKSATRALSDLTKRTAHSHVAPRTQQLFRKLQPVLLARLAKVADADATLNQFVRFVEAYALRGALFESLVANPKLLELLIRTLDQSRFASDLLARQPQLLEDLTRRDETFHRPRTISDHLTRLEEFGATSANLDPVRAYKQRQLLRIILRELLDPENSTTLFAELSDLAEACLLFVNKLLGGDELTIIALGKFGGREINYGADLDVVFVGEDVRPAQNLMVALSQSTPAGMIASLDARLRPDGEKGPLVSSLTAYKHYYRERAQLWEIQALTRARSINGPVRDEFLGMAQPVWAEAGQRVDLFHKVADMGERIRRERGSGSDFADFKTGAGGMIQAEFVIQALQMKNNVWEANWDAAVSKLTARARISPADAEKLTRAYAYLRRCETTLRRWENSKRDAIPNEPEEQTRFTRRLGYAAIDAFENDYRESREAVRRFYECQMKARPA